MRKGLADQTANSKAGSKLRLPLFCRGSTRRYVHYVRALLSQNGPNIPNCDQIQETPAYKNANP